MLAQELEEMRGADLLLHLNAEEEAEFSALLPEKEHTLLYPPVPEAPTGPGGPDIVLIASNNTANVESVVWFLREVAPKAREKAPGVRVKIAGNVESGVRARAPEIYDAYKDWFLGRVEDLGAVYANARLALLPTIDGHGLSIKSVEAMASGLPLVATTHALRGMRADARALDGVTIADGAEAFAAALTRAAGGGAIPSETERRASAPRRYYDAHFSLAAYERSLAALAERLLRV
jgi:glycosyltransferase involved in cell wall biosynthesis